MSHQRGSRVCERRFSSTYLSISLASAVTLVATAALMGGAAPALAAPPGSTPTVEISPTAWDASHSYWDVWGPLYEGNPVIASYGATHTHAYGRDVGRFTYHFSLANVTSVLVSARLSSEFVFYSAPPDGFSDVTLFINNEPLYAQRVIPDNGSGQNYSWSVGSALLHPGDNTISFAVLPDAAYRHGVAIYYQSLVAGMENTPITVSALDLPMGGGSDGDLTSDEVLQSLRSLGFSAFCLGAIVAAGYEPHASLIVLQSPPCLRVYEALGTQVIAIIDQCLARTPPNPACRNLLRGAFRR